MQKVVKLLTLCCNRAKDDTDGICEIEEFQKRQENANPPVFVKQISISFRGKTINDDELCQKDSISKINSPDDITDLSGPKQKPRKKAKKGKRNKKGSSSKFDIKSDKVIEDPPVTIYLDNPLIAPAGPPTQVQQLEQQQEETKALPKPLKGILKKR